MMENNEIQIILSRDRGKELANVEAFKHRYIGSIKKVSSWNCDVQKMVQQQIYFGQEKKKYPTDTKRYLR